MKARQYLQFLLILMMMLFLFSCTVQKQEEKISMGINKSIQTKTVQNLIEKFGNDHKARIEKGVEQVAEKWKNSDGSETDFQEFCLNNFFIGEDLTKTTEKFQKNLESLYGNLHKISRDYSWAIQVEVDSVHTVDYMFANYSAFAHIKDDFFKTKLAFVILLNYPLETLELKNQEGMNWSREKWAEVRLAEYFSDRVPAEISQKVNEAYVAADDYISNYNIYMHHLLDTTSKRLFPEGLKLITHWGLRDELKSHYANPDGFVRQKMIQKVMERIILQEIPEVVVNNDKYDWNPYDNKVYKANSEKVEAVNAEPDTRYKHLHSVYKAEKLMDPYRPDAPSKIDRRFKEDREMLEAEVEGLLKDVLTAPALKDIAALIKKRLGRELEPFDIWYRGFKPTTEYNQAQLHKILKPNGIICVEVPNDFNELQETLVKQQNKESWWISTPDHINYFNVHSLKQLFEKNKYDVILTESSFPVELFPLMGEDYIGNPDIGKQIHKKRINFEKELINSNKNQLKRKIYQKLIEIGIGRSIIMYAAKQ